MIAKTSSGAVAGIDGYGVDVEVDLAAGLPSFSIVGLPDAAVRESRERVSAALRNCGFRLPLKRITVNLAPAGMKKEGAAFDLPIAVGILRASGQVSMSASERTLFLGELALDGRLNQVRGVLPVACYAKDMRYDRLVVPAGNVRETAFLSGIEVIPCEKLEEVVALLNGRLDLPESRTCVVRMPGPGRPRDDLDYCQVAGQFTAKRGMQLAAAGGHHLLMTGPPGSGKTMLARRLPSILPPLEEDEAIECAKIESVTGILGGGLMQTRPFRAPHHSASDAGLIGGGRNASPGEITLAHNGVLFLDELTEFRRNVLETLRQPVEEGRIVISRAGMNHVYPARFQLIAAMNPCPCGYSGSEHLCSCTPRQIQRYIGRISGPLLDRIAIHLPVMAVPVGELSIVGKTGDASKGSKDLKEGVMRADAVQKERYRGLGGIRRNADLSLPMVRSLCRIGKEASSRLDQIQRACGFSARTRKNILLVARTIADIDGAGEVGKGHVEEAVMFRVPEVLSQNGLRESGISVL